MGAFEDDFRALMGFAPMAWQARLYREHFCEGNIPGAVDVPTGLGKTAVMALWLIARARGAPLPRRLVFVVDRRAVVDQATAEAVKLREALGGGARHLKPLLGLNGKLPISTLRGKFADNREWLANPVAPAIVVGTVDMIGSRLLFSGYGVSRKMRPYHAGLLGADTLVLLDEAHLVPPFQHLLRAIERDAPAWAAAEAMQCVPRFRLLPLSATQRDEPRGEEDAPAPFRLEFRDWENDQTAAKRLNAKKRLRFIDPEEKNKDQQLADEAWGLAANGEPKRVIVFCNRRDTRDDGAGPSAEGVAAAIEALATADKKAGTEIALELLVGGRRQRERDQVAKRLEELGFTNNENRKPPPHPTFLVATSAGEVGVDIDADHMVSDLAPWERMVQRLGRVNRRGEGSAEIRVFWTQPKPKKESQPTPAEERALLAFAAKAPLEKLPHCGGDYGHDASPGALRTLAGDSAAKALIEAATTPEPLRPALTRPLVEAWSMTSLEVHTGRPEVAPWLRGWVEEPRQTTLVWRRRLPVRVGVENWPRTKAEKQEVTDFFEAAPPHESEKLEAETFRVVEWLQMRAATILQGARPSEVDAEDDVEEAEVGVTEGAESVHVAEPVSLTAINIAAIALSEAGDFFKAYRLRDLTFDKIEKRAKEIFERDLAEKTLILDARLGGLNEKGLLDNTSTVPIAADHDPERWAESEDQNDPLIRFRIAPDRSQGDKNWRPEFAFVTRRDLDGAPLEQLFVDRFRDTANAEAGRAIARKAQSLDEHEAWAARHASNIAQSLLLPTEAGNALKVAARLHDEGKRSERWQRAFKAARDIRDFGLAGPLAKTRGPIDQALLDGYRHEFGSLFYAERHADVLALSQDWRDLVLHLIAAHHGAARPTIETSACEEAPPSALQERAGEVALRFARLQKRWGPWGLAWWEALLRAADQEASRELEQSEASAAQEAA